jgi:hypothetical protein
MAGTDASARQDSQGESVHERAKSASLVVAIVTILVGADPLDIRNSSHLFRKVDYVAIGFWILAILLFLGPQTAVGFQNLGSELLIRFLAWQGKHPTRIRGPQAITTAARQRMTTAFSSFVAKMISTAPA